MVSYIIMEFFSSLATIYFHQKFLWCKYQFIMLPEIYMAPFLQKEKYQIYVYQSHKWSWSPSSCKIKIFGIIISCWPWYHLEKSYSCIWPNLLHGNTISTSVEIFVKLYNGTITFIIYFSIIFHSKKKIVGYLQYLIFSNNIFLM